MSQKQPTPLPKKLNILVVGDDRVGKSSLLLTYSPRQDDYVPYIVDHFTVTTTFQGERVDVEFTDIVVGDENFPIRHLSYTGKDVFMLCYSTVDEVSLTSIRDEWIPEILRYVYNPCFLLVGTKKDLKEKFRDRAVPEWKARDVCDFYIECSSLLYKTNPVESRVDETFELAIKTGLEHLLRKKVCCKCTIL